MTNSDTIIMKMRQAILDNDHQTIKNIHQEYPDIANMTARTDCSCGCIEYINILDCLPYQTQHSGYLFKMRTTINTFDLLMELGIIQPTNIAFLKKMISSIECEEKADFCLKIFPKFDKKAIEEFRFFVKGYDEVPDAYYNLTQILKWSQFLAFSPNYISQYFNPMFKYLIEECHINSFE